MTPPRPARGRAASRRAFTLIEMLVVVALIGVFATVSLPPMFHALKRSPIRQAISDLAEVCQRARMMAIAQGRPAELVINAGDLTATAQLASESAAPDARLGPEAPPEALATGDAAPVPKPVEAQSLSVRIPESVAFKQLMINRRDMLESTQARVRFQPNGTCDEFIAVLLSESNEERAIRLEMATGRETIDVIR